uniref:Uncharacterized protein n=1 Tax=Odontella aurita TaxID=265563 RepID=A0A7S4I8C3_9STRA|mmetsp:Transcript_21340/g.62155  ORF Transcript_21340/g.62155 Transcript_21340/m.62155 type:complete len:1226 (+) Transcript_21340:682-4359(+)
MALLLKAVDPTASPNVMASRGCLDEVRTMSLGLDAAPARSRMSTASRGGSSSELLLRLRRPLSPRSLFSNRQRCHSDSAVGALRVPTKRQAFSGEAMEEMSVGRSRVVAPIEESDGDAAVCVTKADDDDDDGSDVCCLDKLDLPPSCTEITEEMTNDSFDDNYAQDGGAAADPPPRSPRPTDSPLLRLRNERCLGAEESRDYDDDDDDINADEDDCCDSDGDNFVPPRAQSSVMSVAQFSAFASGGEYVSDAEEGGDDSARGGDADDDGDDDGSDCSVGPGGEGLAIEGKDATPGDEGAPVDEAAESLASDEEGGSVGVPPPPPRRSLNRRQIRGRHPSSFSGASLRDLDLSEVLPTGHSNDDGNGSVGANDSDAARSSSLSAVTSPSSLLSSSGRLEDEDELDSTKLSERAADEDDENEDDFDEDGDESFDPLVVAPCAPSPAASRAGCLIKRPILERSGGSSGDPATNAPTDDFEVRAEENVFRRRPIPRPRGLHSRCSTMPAASFAEDVGNIAASVSFEEVERPPPQSAPPVLREGDSFVDSSSSGPEPYHLRRLRKDSVKPAALRRHARSNTLPTILSPGVILPQYDEDAAGDSSTHLLRATSTAGAMLKRSELRQSESAATRSSRRVVLVRSARPGRLSGHHRHQSLPASAIADLGGGMAPRGVWARDDSFLLNERPGGLRRSSTMSSRQPSLITRRPSSLNRHGRTRTLPASMVADLGAMAPPPPPAGSWDDAFLDNERGSPASLGSRASLLRRQSSVASRQSLSQSQHRRHKTLPASIVAELSSVLAVSDGATPSASNGSLLSGPGGGQRSASNSGRNIVRVDGNARPASILHRQRSEVSVGGSPGASRPAALRRRQSSRASVRSASASPRLSRAPHSRPHWHERQDQAQQGQGQGDWQQMQQRQQQQQQQHVKKTHIRKMSPHAPFREILEGAGLGECTESAVEAHRRQLLESATDDQPQGIRGKLLRKKGQGHRRIQSLPAGACLSSSVSSIHSSASSRAGRPPLPPSASADDASPTNGETAAMGVPSVFSDDDIRYGAKPPSPRMGGSPRGQRRSPYPELLADRPRRGTSNLSEASRLGLAASSSLMSSTSSASASSASSPPSCHHRRALSADSAMTAKIPASVAIEEENDEGAVGTDNKEGENEQAPVGNEEVDNCCRDHFEKEARRSGSLGEGLRPAFQSVKKSVRRAVVPESVRAQFRNKGVELKRAKGRLV